MDVICPQCGKKRHVAWLPEKWICSECRLENMRVMSPDDFDEWNKKLDKKRKEWYVEW